MSDTILPGEEVGGACARVIFTGPNGMSDYRAQVVSDYEYIGEAANNKSSTTSTKFLSREAEGAEYPPARKQYVGRNVYPIISLQVGEIGWMVGDGFMNMVNDGVVKSGHQIQRKWARQALEDRTTQKMQNLEG
eukprot:sb/3474779/